MAGVFISVVFGCSLLCSSRGKRLSNLNCSAKDIFFSGRSSPVAGGAVRLVEFAADPIAMDEPPRYEMAQTAYIKLILHSLKHRSSAVNGVLLGRVSDHKGSSVVEIADSVPLFHSHLGLLPNLEISLIMIEEYYGAKGLSVVGYFHANERHDDSELGGVAKNIGDHIYRYFPQAAILLLDNKKLEALPKGKDRSPVMRLYAKDSSKNWKLISSDSSGSNQLVTKEPSANAVLSDYILSEKWRDIVDFDDHLDDISKDWLNPDLFN